MGSDSIDIALVGGARLTRSYRYDASGNRTRACSGSTCSAYTYGGGAGPHAVSAVNGNASGYAYNASGEMTHDAGRSLTWSAFGKALTITRGNTTLTLRYGPGNRRTRKTVTGPLSETVTYLGSAERLDINGRVSIRRTLGIADIAIIDTGGAQSKRLYPIADHLGSTIAIADSSGSLIQGLAYADFGQRYSAGWTSALTTAQALSVNTTLSDRGYTGQESLDAIGLVDYNARLYDPSLGRFLSVDPLIGHPGSTQSINPYSYVENNPLNSTDPTGECVNLVACSLVNGPQGTKTGPREMANAINKSGLPGGGSMGSDSIDITLAGGASLTRSYRYDASGNRTRACSGNTCTVYSYGGNGAGPHAVSAVNGNASGYAYNASGEMTKDNGRSLTWSAFGKALTITKGNTTVTIDYGPGNRRTRKTVTGSLSETVTYLGSAERLDINGRVSIRRTLGIADIAIIDTGGAQSKRLYPIADHLGSTIAIADSSGSLIQGLAYADFGRRYSAGWGAALTAAQALAVNTTLSDRGYTGQESLDAIGLDDYNARLYDPGLGRFLSVDPLIGHPGSTQSINPYSYVENNPLNKTDPTGEMSCTPSGAGKTVTCTNTPLGSRIPQKTTVKVGSNGKVTTSGAGALPGGGIAMSTDGTSSLTISSAGRQSQGTTGQNPQKTADHTKITNQAPPNAAGGGSNKAVVYALMKGLKLNVAKGHYWQDIYDAKKEGSAADWTRILKAAHNELSFFKKNLSDHDYRLYFGLGNNVSARRLFIDRTQQSGSLQIIMYRAQDVLAGKGVKEAIHLEGQILVDKGVGKLVGMAGEFAEKAFQRAELLSHAGRAAEVIAEQRRIGPIIICDAANCALGN